MTNFIKRHPILWAYLFFCYFSFTLQVLIKASGMSGSVGLRQSILMSTLWLIPLLIWPSKSKTLAAVIGLVLWAASLAGLGYWLIYGQDFSQSAIFIIFESNMAEGTEFLQSYIRWWHPLTFIAFSVPPFLMWRAMSDIVLPTKVRYTFVGAFALVVCWPFINTLQSTHDMAAARYHLLHRLEPVAPWNLVVGYKKYRDELSNMESLLSSNRSVKPLQGFSIDPARAPQTVVLVLGESTNRQRMSLYGYSRKTTPKLDAIRNELVVFNDVITPRPYTIEALQQILSFSDNSDPQAFFSQPTLLNMMKQAGYEITWITNQQTQTRRNTLLTTLSQLADHQVYLNNNRSQNASQYDGAVIEPFLHQLHSNAPKKFIVIHLLGTHRKYDYRYPPSYASFSGRDNLPEWVSDRNIGEYNSYDNAILYNDHVVSEIINGLKQVDDKSLMIYFSDHGEEVYDYAANQFCGRNEGAPTPAMYTVPFITWSSTNWTDSTGQTVDTSWKAAQDRPFLNTDFIHTLPDMIGITFTSLDTSKSLVSENFVEQPRWIGNPDAPKSLMPYSVVENQHRDSNNISQQGVTIEYLEHKAL